MSRLIRRAQARTTADVLDSLSTGSLIELVTNINEVTNGEFTHIDFHDMTDVGVCVDLHGDEADVVDLLRFMKHKCGNGETGEIGAFDVDAPYFSVTSDGGLWSCGAAAAREFILDKADELAAVIVDADIEDPALANLKAELVNAMMNVDMDKDDEVR
jgi:hypothetical protein